MKELRVIDSHTGGEPTRIIVAGGPDLGSASISEQLKIFREQHDDLRSWVVNEPRGSEVIVGALLCKSSDPSCSAGIIFFNNVGYLGMCGHGTIGLAVTLAYLGLIEVGQHKVETPVGKINFTMRADKKTVCIANVPSYCYRNNVSVETTHHGMVTGDIAWGGNWFFLVSEHAQDLSASNHEQLVNYTWDIRQSLELNNIKGANDQLIDHIELFGPPSNKAIADSRNFVLCPGKAFDRSPCGTGVSAKLACLYENGQLKENQLWRQESIIGSVFEGFVTIENNQIIPHIQGKAYISADAKLILDSDDPFQKGIIL